MGERSLTDAWAATQARLPARWTLDRLQCASAGLEPRLRSDDWVAVAIHESGEERAYRAVDPFAALDGLARSFT